MAQQIAETSTDMLTAIIPKRHRQNFDEWLRTSEEPLIYAAALCDLIGGALLGVMILCLAFAPFVFSESAPLWIGAAIAGIGFRGVRRLRTVIAVHGQFR